MTYASFNNCQRGPRNRKRFLGHPGFTLLELLMVLGVLALLALILLPAADRVRLWARRAVCSNNLHSLGSAQLSYQADFNRQVPICWANISSDHVNPWKSWRMCLLPYTAGVGVFNCTAAQDNGTLGEVIHTIGEMAGQDCNGTANAGSYGVIYQMAPTTFQVVNYDGAMARGSPAWSPAYPTAPGIVWQDPTNSVYLADSCVTKGPISHPTVSHRGYGASAIYPPSDSRYWVTNLPSYRFADRHLGTNALFLDGRVESYATQELESMTAGGPGCIWDMN